MCIRDRDNNDTNGLYRYLLIKQCNSLNDIMPFIFEKIADYTEILLPNELLKEDSVIRNLVENIDNKDWQDVEIIGWLYQYYISEKKDKIMESKKKYKKNEIPAATQLFTPDWIVRYMVENSLGRYWLESHPEDHELKKNWEFYLERQTELPSKEIEQYLDPTMKIEEVKVFDPACGSGHILVYVFDILYQIYQRAGYIKEKIPRLIIENNLYGLEIDDRAYQLSCLSVIMKGLEYNNRFLQEIQANDLKINISSIRETNELSNEEINYLIESQNENNSKKIRNFINNFYDAKIFGSLIKLEEFDKEFFNNLYKNISNYHERNMFKEQIRSKLLYLLPKLIKQSELIIENQYDVVITNPPYMGNRNMEKKLKKFLNNNYKDVKKDLFSAFIERNYIYTKARGHLGFMSPFVWMFITSFEKLRKNMITNKNISSLVQLEYSGFSGATVPICTFTLRNYKADISGEFIKLTNFKGSHNQPIKVKQSIKNPNVEYRYSTLTQSFNQIPSNPIAFWASESILNIFSNSKLLGDMIPVKKGMDTGNNSLFLRYWYEVNNDLIGLNLENGKDTIKNNKKWIPYDKGGAYRKWFGNNEYVIDWSNNGYDLKHSKANLRSKHLYFKKSITWSALTSSKTSFRYSKYNSIFDSSGSSMFPDQNNIFYYLGLSNTKLINKFLEIINPTLNYGSGSVSKIPVKFNESKFNKEIVIDNINISKRDWDSFETSWDFRKHPILTYKNEADTIKEAFNNWSEFAEEQFYHLKENEEKLNEIFIKIYGLEGELNPEVKEKDVTVRKADRARDIRSFMSYAVGCMLGRYSLDEEGLVYAGGEFDHSKYETFKVDKDGIIPVLDKEYFDDDIVARFVEFVRVIFGEENSEENLKYIADALIEGGTSGQDTARETIRRYFLFDFIKDHTSEYNKCPIYWLFQSDGRGKAFNALIYMHRYDKGTVSRVRTDYLHELQNKIESEKVRLQNIINSDLSGRQRTQAKKELETLEKQTAELKEYDQKLNHLANQQIEIELDDGVKENYAKFEKVLKKI